MKPSLFSRRRFVSACLAVGATHVVSGAASRAVREQGGVVEPSMRYVRGEPFPNWQAQLRQRLESILVLPDEHGPLNARSERVRETDSFVQDRIQFDAEKGERVPGYLLRPKRRNGPLPVMICLQGHSPGMHISLGEARNSSERKSIEGGRDLARQAVNQGWAALVIEQRAFGVRAGAGTCNDIALRALHGGRPLTGQRVYDVRRAIDFIGTQPDLDSSRIGCMGNSTGGTVTFYAACVDTRIALAVVSCSFCTFADSWLSLPHCACGYLPGIGPVADMPDLAGLIAPRKLLIVAGQNDHLARIEGVRKGFAQVQALYSEMNAAGFARLVVGGGGHEFYPNLAWPVVKAWME